MGSFFNVCISRIPEDASILFPPSKCPKCGKRISLFDLIPVISYIILRGRCRSCGGKISLRYPVVEVLTAALLLAFYIRCGISVDLFLLASFSSILILISFIDIEHMEIPDFLLLCGIVIGLAKFAYNGNIAESMKGICFGFVFMWLIGSSARYIFKKDALGEGDVKLVVMLGSFLGIQKTFISIFAGSMIGSLVGISLILLKIIKREDYIPFGPFLSLGAIVSIFL